LSHNRVKILRERRGLTQIELSKISGVSRATIAALETDKRPRIRPSTRTKLARALRVKPRELEGDVSAAQKSQG
jgi:transcriptional regulator with XRE-family HTH domain